ncbi:MAG: hypothetical protein J5903_04205, partial [Clostridia bacterium]|nr:hypothetical protein [Clostridia bacterium]
VCLTLYVDGPLAREEAREIKKKYPDITQMKLVVGGENKGRIVGRKQLSDDELFIEYYKARYGAEPDEDIMLAYRSILEDVYAP